MKAHICIISLIIFGLTCSVASNQLRFLSGYVRFHRAGDENSFFFHSLKLPCEEDIKLFWEGIRLLKV